MNRLERDFIEEMYKAEEMLHKINKELSQVKPDNAKIKVSSKENALQLYIRETKKDGLYGRYLPISEKERAVNIVKGEYYRSLKKVMEDRIKFFEKGIRYLNEKQTFEVYRKLGKGKQKLVEPIEISDEEYRRQWENSNKTFG